MNRPYTVTRDAEPDRRSRCNHLRCCGVGRATPTTSELAGRWELPGGKVALGETEQGALARELAEELGIEVAVGDRLGSDVELNEITTLRAYRARLLNGEPHPHDHQALRWVHGR